MQLRFAMKILLPLIIFTAGIFPLAAWSQDYSDSEYPWEYAKSTPSKAKTSSSYSAKSNKGTPNTIGYLGNQGGGYFDGISVGGNHAGSITGFPISEKTYAPTITDLKQWK